MAVKIRMKRFGTKDRASWRIVVSEAKMPRDGRFIENLGTYNPQKAENNFAVDLERAKYWIQRGAQPSNTVRSILKKAEKAERAAKTA